MYDKCIGFQHAEDMFKKNDVPLTDLARKDLMKRITFFKSQYSTDLSGHFFQNLIRKSVWTSRNLTNFSFLCVSSF